MFKPMVCFLCPKYTDNLNFSLFGKESLFGVEKYVDEQVCFEEKHNSNGKKVQMPRTPMIHKNSSKIHCIGCSKIFAPGEKNLRL